MTRGSSANILSQDEQSLDGAWQWYQFQRALIGEELSRILSAIGRGESLAMSRYFGSTREELLAEFESQQAELRYLAMFAMLAATEAAMRVDLIVRVSNRKKDDVSRRFREIAKNRTLERIRLEEDILDTWKDRSGLPGLNRTIAEFKGALNLRHWLAHGRYWKPKLGRAAGYYPFDVFDVSKALLQAVGL